MAVANITSIVLPGEFVPHKDKWENYKEQLYFALEAAGPIIDAQKRALFLSQCGKKAFSLIVSLLSPIKPSEVPFDEIISTLDRFFITTPHPILETQKFYERKQRSDESVTTYIAALREISPKCAFQDLDRRIIEQFILGLYDTSIRREILKMSLEDMTYNKVIQRALNLEALKNQCHQSKGGNMASSNYRDVVYEGASASTSGTSTADEPMDVNIISTNTKKLKPCVHCNKRHASKCRFRNATCYRCPKKGHTKAACDSDSDSRMTQQKPRVNECCEKSCDCESEFNSETEQTTTEENYGVYGVSNPGTNRVKPYVVDVTINGVPVVMEVDSGAARSILPHSVYKQNRAVFPELKPCATKLMTWTNTMLSIQGEAVVTVERDGRKEDLPIIISCGEGPALLGRTWFQALGIQLQVNAMTEIEVTESFPRLFDNEMSDYCGPLVHLSVKKEAKPVFLRARPVPFPLRKKVDEEIKRMVSDGILTPVKHSQWATPLRLVPKQDGSIRICGDYRSTVNASCEVESYPLPTANEAFFQLAAGKFFSKLDLKHAYNQLKVDDETATILTLNTTMGLMKMKRLAFGVHAAPAIFQRLMSSVLAGIEGVACLLDDVVVCGSSMEEHDLRLQLVLKRLDEIGLKLNKKKCTFASKRVSFLGYEIDENGVHPLREKVQEIMDKPAPTEKKSLKAFLGLYNFYERFIKEKAVILHPLYRLLKDKVEWQWKEAEQEAFDAAKKVLTSDLTLVHYSLEKELILLCDASDYGVGAILVHKMSDGTERPVIMGSRTLHDHELRYAQIDKEALAIMYGLKKFRQYLVGRKFSIYTDHKPLLGIFGRNKPIPELISSRMLRWALALNTFDYELYYRPGKDLGNADSLSRWPTESNEKDDESDLVDDLFLLSDDFMGINSKQIAKETDKDAKLSKVKNFLLHGWPFKVDDELLPYFRKKDSLSLNKECIMWANRVIIPASLQDKVLKALHDGHSGIVQTKMLARGYVWFPTIDIDIERMITSCDNCQLNRKNPAVTTHVWPPESKPWSRIHIDFMGPFMSKTFLVVVDAYSKWPVIEIVPSMTSKTVINILRRIFADHGLPEVLVSDNGLAFMSQEFQEFIRKNHIRHITGAPYHPATNGQAERTIQTIKDKLKKQPEHWTWSERVGKVLFQMRTVPSTVTGKSPAEMLCGRRFRTALSLLHPDYDNTPELEKEREKERTRKKKFNKGDHVLLRMYNLDNKWQRGEVMSMIAPSVYEVRAADGSTHRRHVDQILRTRPPILMQAQASDISSDMNGDSYCEGHSDSESVIIPPPEEWAQIIGI